MAACSTASDLSCSIPVRVGLFFDGTNNNLERDKNGKRTGVIIDTKTKKHMKIQRALGIGLLVFPITGICAEATVPVSIHGVNYSGDDFSYIVEDPLDKRNRRGGESVSPFGAGGIICCYTLPQTWSSGIQVKVHAKYWVKGEKGDLTEMAETKMVEVPPYVDGKPGELWVIRAGNGSLSVVSSDYQPDNPRWPGAVKGWPVPSLAYKRERWALAMKEAQIFLDTSTNSVAEFKADAGRFAREMWEMDKKYSRKEIADFSGPEDIRYVDYLRLRLDLAQKQCEKRFNYIKEHRP